MRMALASYNSSNGIFKKMKRMHAAAGGKAKAHVKYVLWREFLVFR